jgi:hypothetical protein
MNNVLTPFVVATLNSIYLGALPLFVGWRLKRLEEDVPVTRGERKTTYAIIACVTALHIVEGMKGAFFGMEYYNQTEVFSFIARAGIFAAMNIVAEIAHVLTFAVVLMRTIQLVTPPQQFEEESKMNMEVIGAYTLLASRIFCPFLMWSIQC